MSLVDLPVSVIKEYHELRQLPDGRVCGVLQLLYHWTLHIDIDYYGYADRYCFATKELAVDALHAYDGIIEPTGWHRHPKSGRRRNLATGEKWVEY